MKLRHVCLCGQEFDWRGPLVQHILCKVGHGVDVEVNRAFCDAIYKNHEPAAEIRVRPQQFVATTKVDGAPLYRGF